MSPDILQLQTCVRWRKRLLKSSDDHLWAEYITVFQPTRDDLLMLLKSEVRTGFKARALLLCLVPDTSWCPVLAAHTLPKTSFLKRELEGFALLRRDLQMFCAELIFELLDLIERTANGISEWCKLRDRYQPYLRELLAIFPPSSPIAVEAFRRYELNDIILMNDVDFSSGYYPFQSLMYDPRIPMDWKRLADGAIREIIRAEEAGTSEPRAIWERALDCYVRSFTYIVYHLVCPYDEAFLAEQFLFITSLERGAAHICDDLKQSPCRTKLAAIQHGEPLRSFVRSIMLNVDPPFAITSSETLDLTRWLLQRYGDDAELAFILREAIRIGAPIVEQQRQGSSESPTAKLKRELLIRMQ